MTFHAALQAIGKPQVEKTVEIPQIEYVAPQIETNV